MSAAQTVAAKASSPQTRQLALRIEKMQPAGLGRKADLIAARDLGLRRHAGDRDAGGADPRLQQDLRAELFDDFDAGIEAEARRAVAEHEMFRTHAHDQL